MSKPVSKIKALVTAAKYWFRVGGVPALIAHLWSFAIRTIFRYEDWYLTKHEIRGQLKGFIECPKELTIKIIRSKQEITKLIDNGSNITAYISMAQFMRNYDKQLEAGGILCCAFSGPELIHTRWMALAEKAKKLMDETPFPIDFSTEAYVGGLYTLPEFRGKGLPLITAGFIYSYLFELGIKTAKGLVLKDNVSSIATLKKANMSLYGEVAHLKLLRWNHWKVKIYDQRLINSK
jgi:RimJ/RimL family protein N-acetyltransferase